MVPVGYPVWFGSRLGEVAADCTMRVPGLVCPPAPAVVARCSPVGHALVVLQGTCRNPLFVRAAHDMGVALAQRGRHGNYTPARTLARQESS